MVLAAYLDHAATYYAGPDGKTTKEYRAMKDVIRVVNGLYGDLAAVEFGPQRLKVIRQQMIQAGLCRSLINRRVDRVKRMFRWAASEELAPVSVYESLRTLAGLRRGRTEARESDPVRPVDPAVVDATLPKLPTHVRAMVKLMRFTGMRPSEVCRMTLGQIDRAGEIWTYRPTTHKTATLGKDRAIPLGPRARAVLIDHLRGRVLAPDAPIFSPRVAREERFAEMRARRVSKVQPSQVDRRADNPKRLPAEWYTTCRIAHAVKAAAEKAKVAHWHPYQLRHLFASEVRKAAGLEAAQVLLGHARADVTQVYAEKNLDLAVATAAKIG